MSPFVRILTAFYGAPGQGRLQRRSTDGDHEEGESSRLDCKRSSTTLAVRQARRRASGLRRGGSEGGGGDEPRITQSRAMDRSLNSQRSRPRLATRDAVVSRWAAGQLPRVGGGATPKGRERLPHSQKDPTYRAIRNIFAASNLDEIGKGVVQARRSRHRRPIVVASRAQRRGRTPDPRGVGPKLIRPRTGRRRRRQWVAREAVTA